jgi:hypothetical protein
MYSNERYIGDDVCLPDSSEVAEFRDEDAFSKLKLDRLMLLYEELATPYSGEFKQFWNTWWHVMEDYAPAAVFSNATYSMGTRFHNEGLPVPWDDE